ncbi:MAG: hypothetical protein WAU88_16065 [Candidatus Zixiibacteriota bacterium]
MKRISIIMFVLLLALVLVSQSAFAGTTSNRTGSTSDLKATDSTRAAAVANNILRSVKPGGKQNKAIDHIDTVSATSDIADNASLDITIAKRDLVSWIYLDTTCTIIKLLFNDTLEAGRYRFHLNPKVVGQYFYSSDIATAIPAKCWQVLRVGDKRTIEKTMVPQ